MKVVSRISRVAFLPHGLGPSKVTILVTKTQRIYVLLLTAVAFPSRRTSEKGENGAEGARLAVPKPREEAVILDR